MANFTQVAVVVRGDKNDSRITFPCDLTDANLDILAKTVAKKDPGRVYHIVRVIGKRMRKEEPLYTWHVGEGFEHHEGWWIREEE